MSNRRVSRKGLRPLARQVPKTEYTPFQHEPEATAVRLIVRRVKPTPGSQLALFAAYSYHAFITDPDGDTLDLEADPIQQGVRATLRLRMPSATPHQVRGRLSSTASGSTISPRAVSPPTPPGWPSK